MTNERVGSTVCSKAQLDYSLDLTCSNAILPRLGCPDGLSWFLL